MDVGTDAGLNNAREPVWDSTRDLTTNLKKSLLDLCAGVVTMN